MSACDVDPIIIMSNNWKDNEQRTLWWSVRGRGRVGETIAVDKATDECGRKDGS